MGDLLKYLGVGVVAILLGGLVGHFAFPQTETVQLPGETDTVRVTEREVDSIRVVHHDTTRVVTTDTVNTVTTRWRTRVDTVHVLPTRFFLDWATIASRGDTSYFGLVELGADSAGIYRRSQVEAHVTLGPVRSITTGPQGLDVDYGNPPRPSVSLGGIDLSPGFACGLAGAGGLSLGLGIGSLF